MPDSDQSASKKADGSRAGRNPPEGISRRQFLAGSSALGLAVGVGPWVIAEHSARAADKRLKLL